MSAQARDRKLEQWYKRIKDGEIKLPRFQRPEAWDKGRIRSLLSTVIHDLPLGITLILEVDKEQFISRYLISAEIQPPFPKVIEHLLDGQQRLTALWRAMHNNYEWEKYFLYIREFDLTWFPNNPVEDPLEDWAGDEGIICQSRWIGKRSGKIMPEWADDPEKSFKRGCIPFELLRPEDIGPEIDGWINQAVAYKKPASGSTDYEKLLELYMEEKKKLSDCILRFRETIKHYNLPFLSLPSETPKDVALDVFINMNTNSKPLSQYDIIVAEIEGIKETSVHELQNELSENNPMVKNYFDLSYLILYTSALIQDKLPNKKGIWDMDRREVIENWKKMETGLALMADFLASQKIFDEQRLPTNAVLSVIAALFTHIPEKGDEAGKAKVLLKKYLWSSFFTDRYENSAASRAYVDYIALKNIITSKKKDDGSLFAENDVPVLNRTAFPLATEEQLLNVTWPKNETIRGRGILAVSNYFNASDFADGSTLSVTNIHKRHYHHIFPDALINEALQFYPDQMKSYVALNCALITDTTNLKIGRKEPLQYLKDRFKWSNETIIEQRLSSHLIPIRELAQGSYEGLSDKEKAEKIKLDYESFLLKRAQLIHSAVRKLTDGEEIYASDVLPKSSNEIAS